MSDSGWSKEKVGVIFAGVTALSAVLGGSIVTGTLLGMRENTERIATCTANGAEWRHVPETSYYECVRG